MIKHIFFSLILLFLLLNNSILLAFHHPDTLKTRALIDSSNAFTYSQTDKSVKYAHEAFQLALAQKYTKGQTDALIALSKSLYVKGDYDESLKYGSKLDSLSKAIGYERGRSYAVNNRGLIFLAQDNIKSALKEFQTALQYNQRLAMRKPQAANYFNIGICHIHLDDLDAAESALRNSLAICKEVKDSVVMIMALNRLAEVHVKKGKLNAGIELFNQALKENKDKNLWEKSFAYNNLGNVYLDKGNYGLAVQYGLKAKALAETMNANWDKQQAFELLHRTYLKLGDYKQAYRYLEQHKMVSDSILSSKKEQEINKLMLHQKQQENEELKKNVEISKQRSMLNKLVNGMIALAVVSLIIITIIVHRKRKETAILNAELARINHSKDQLFSVIAHDLRSPIMSIVQTVDMLRSNELSKAETQLVLDNFFERISATASMLENLLLWVQDQRKKTETNREAVSLPIIMDQILILGNLMAKDKDIKIHHLVQDVAEAYADKQHLHIIFQNILSNAIKFTPEHGNIWISYQTKGNRIEMEIRDSGVGIPEEKLDQIFTVMGKDISTYGTANEKGIGIGLILVKKYAAENNMEIDIKSGKSGTAFTLSFEIYKSEQA